MKKPKRKIAHQSRRQQLQAIPDYLLGEGDTAQDLTIARLDSPEACLVLRDFAEGWGEGNAEEQYKRLREDIATATIVAALWAVWLLDLSHRTRERAQRAQALRGRWRTQAVSC